jgi:hypothetical protein
MAQASLPVPVDPPALSPRGGVQGRPHRQSEHRQDHPLQSALRRPGEDLEFPGTTTALRVGTLKLPEVNVDVLDMPGLYDMALESPEAAIVRNAMNEVRRRGDLVVVIVDAANLARNLTLVGQLLGHAGAAHRLPEHDGRGGAAGMTVDAAALSARWAFRWCRWWRRKAEGIDTLRHTLRRAAGSIGPDEFRARDLPVTGAPHRVLAAWARTVADEVTSRSEAIEGRARQSLRAHRSHPYASRARHGHLHGGDGRPVLRAVLAGGPADEPDRRERSPA